MKRILAAILTILLIGAAGIVSASAEGFEDIYGVGDVDLDGRISINDATLMQRFLAQMNNPTTAQLARLDADCDGVFSINDATHLQRVLAESYQSLVGKKGIDISSHNDSVDMAAVKAAGFDFVMIRCGYGKDDPFQDDTCFVENVKKCEEIGMPWGVYLFSYAVSEQEAYSEVEHVDRLLKAEKEKGYLPTLPIVLDVEWTNYHEVNNAWNAENINAVTTIFIDEIVKRGYYPMIYTGYGVLEDFFSDHLRNDVDCWFAQWYLSPDAYYYNCLGIWQYGGEKNYLESPEIEGVGVVDMNYVYRDYPLIIKNRHYNGF